MEFSVTTFVKRSLSPPLFFLTFIVKWFSLLTGDVVIHVCLTTPRESGDWFSLFLYLFTPFLLDNYV